MEIQETLQKYGLSEKQASIYLAALGLGTSSITHLAKRAHIKRPTTYLLVEELIKLGLIIPIPQGKLMHYRAEDPEILVKIVDEKRERLSRILPKLKTLYKKNLKQPKIFFYEGKDKLYEMYSDFFKSKEIWGIFSFDKYSDLFSDKEIRSLNSIISRHGGIIHDMIVNTKKGKEFAEAKFRTAMSENKLLPQGLELDTDILVSENKVALISFENLIGVVIIDKGIASAQKILLQSLWGR